MKRILFLTAVAYSFTNVTKAQLPALYGSQGIEFGSSVAATADSGFIVGASFQNTIQITPFGVIELTASGPNTDMALVKYDKVGDAVWAKRIGGQFTDETAAGIATDLDGNVLVVGYFGNTAAGGPMVGNFEPNGVDTFLTFGNEDGFLAKYNADLTELKWVVRIGNIEAYTAERVWDIAVDTAGYAYITGACHGLIDFNPLFEPNVQTLPDSSAGIFCAKYDTNGYCQWVVLVDVNSDSLASECYSAVDLDANGNVILAGNFRGFDVNVDPVGFTQPTLNANGESDIFFALYDASNATCQWVRQVGSTEQDLVSPGGMRVDKVGNICMTGVLSGTTTIDFATGAMPHTVTNSSLYLTKFGPFGNTLWAKGFNSSLGDGGTRIAFDSDNNVLLSGWMNDTIDFGNGIVRSAFSTSADAFLATFDSMGVCNWVFNFGGDNTANSNGPSKALGLTIDREDNVILTGQLYGEMADLNPSETDSTMFSSLGDKDAFVLKLTRQGMLWADTSSVGIAATESMSINLYPNPASDIVYINANQDLQHALVTVCDLTGRIAIQQKLNGTKNFNVSVLPPGMYITTLSDVKEIFRCALVTVGN